MCGENMDVWEVTWGEEGRRKRKTTNDDKSRLFMGFCECAKYSLVSVEEK